MTNLKPLGPPASSPAATADAGSSAHKGWRSRGYLPHFDSADLIQHIVFGLADALPPGAAPPSAMHRDRMLDASWGECLLRRETCAAIVEDILLYADGDRYRLLAWCVMPNHVHVIAEQMPGVPLETIVQAWKSAAAHRVNRTLGRRGRLWRREYFDRLATSIAYVEANPVAAKLVAKPEAWPFSSARLRQGAHAGEDAGGPRDRP